MTGAKKNTTILVATTLLFAISMIFKCAYYNYSYVGTKKNLMKYVLFVQDDVPKCKLQITH